MQFSRTPRSCGLAAPLLGLATLAAGFLAAPAGAASGQALNGTDTLTVSGNGTVGIQNGQAVSNSTSSYSAYSTVNGATVTTNGASGFSLASGGTVSNAKPGGGYGLYDLSSGAVTITGGSISAGQYGTGLYDLGSGPITISGGSISGGQNGYGMYAGGNGAITITGGTFSGGQYGYGLEKMGSGTVTISGGTFTGGQSGNGLIVNGNGAVTISGGTFTASGQYSCGLQDYSGSMISLFSQGDSTFTIDGVAMNNTTLSGKYTSGKDTISGTLANGDVLNTTFYDTGTINLNPGITPPASAAPEPSAVAIWAFVALGAAGLVLKARKRKVAA